MTLIGDGIENPANARVMLDVAGMFEAGCCFRDRKDLARSWDAADFGALPRIALDAVAAAYQPVLACETLAGAADVYGFRLPASATAALLVGNERFGLAADALAIAQQAVRIPLASRHLTSLNVAAASAVALYYLGRGGGPGSVLRDEPERHRPELLLVGGHDHFELGSAIRSAAAFGWDRLLLTDRGGVWFGVDRGTRAEGRAAARRGRNPIRVIPDTTAATPLFQAAVVVTVRGDSPPARGRSGGWGNLAGGAAQVVVVPDESSGPFDPADLGRLAKRVRLVRPDLPAGDYVYHYRAVASIVLAEVARQVGRTAATGAGHPEPRRPRYRAALTSALAAAGELVSAEELEQY